jgi:AcrR family transcriptional regulator
MTQRALDICSAALTLFANQGYDATTTLEIAKAAGVSEALIFRHFGSKLGLLQALLDQGVQHVKSSMAVLQSPLAPIERLTAYLEHFAHTLEANAPFWRLLHSLRTQSTVANVLHQHYGAVYQNIHAQLAKLAADLGSSQARIDAQLLYATLDGLAVHYVSGQSGEESLLELTRALGDRILSQIKLARS